MRDLPPRNKRGKGAGLWRPLHGEDRSQGQRIGQPEPLRQAGLNPPYSPGSPRFYDGRAKRGDAADEQTFLTGLICYPNLLRHGFAELSEPSLALCHRDQGEYDRAGACHSIGARKPAHVHRRSTRDTAE